MYILRNYLGKCSTVRHLGRKENSYESVIVDKIPCGCLWGYPTPNGVLSPELKIYQGSCISSYNLLNYVVVLLRKCDENITARNEYPDVYWLLSLCTQCVDWRCNTGKNLRTLISALKEGKWRIQEYSGNLAPARNLKKGSPASLCKTSISKIEYFAQNQQIVSIQSCIDSN